MPARPPNLGPWTVLETQALAPAPRGGHPRHGSVITARPPPGEARPGPPSPPPAHRAGLRGAASA